MRALIRSVRSGSSLLPAFALVLAMGLSPALAGPLKMPKAPKAPAAPVDVGVDVEAPDLNVTMSVGQMLAALGDAARKLETSADTLFGAEMELLEALGKADLVLEYRARVEALQAEASGEERASEMVEITTDQALIDAMIEALTDKKNKLDDERKAKAREATVQIMVARLMAVATSEDAGRIGLATADMSRRVSEGDEALVNDISQHSDDPKAFVGDARSRAVRIGESAAGFARQSKSVKEVMDTYRKKRKLFDEIKVEEPKARFEASGF